jgi:hypothetical protein
MAISARDHVIHFAEQDAEELAVPFREIPSQQWDGLANAAWSKAADEADLSDTERKQLHGVYLDTLIAACAKIEYQFYATDVDARHSCPGCGERETDKLVWSSDETVTCANCGVTYRPGAAHVN